jgi:hypothetical protein
MPGVVGMVGVEGVIGAESIMAGPEAPGVEGAEGAEGLEGPDGVVCAKAAPTQQVMVAASSSFMNVIPLLLKRHHPAGSVMRRS